MNHSTFVDRAIFDLSTVLPLNSTESSGTINMSWNLTYPNSLPQIGYIHGLLSAGETISGCGAIDLGSGRERLSPAAALS